ncbi:protein of unknown function [Legionella fallonii LLAP-10]|uniref:Uncharacterized protein n=1 Tax=Legionella fallonii LLAP-10 TaxID=1212491 RepID=A0A098G568_9GAMM|nr:protein of unknown function [Legionella fallonii LLAP-10]
MAFAIGNKKVEAFAYSLWLNLIAVFPLICYKYRAFKIHTRSVTYDRVPWGFVWGMWRLNPGD